MKLYNNNCFDILPIIPEKSIDMIICDLPYGITKCKWDTPIDLKQLWEQYNRIIKNNGVIALFGIEPFSSQLRLSNFKMYKYDWIWKKTQATGHLNANKQPLRAYENILIFYKKQPTYNPQKTQNHSPIHSYTKYIVTQNNTELYGKMNKELRGGGNTDRYPRNIIKFASDKQKCKLHTTQKPVALLEYLIRTYTNEKDIVLDNCMGSGSTGVAALKLGRQFIGIEIEPKYYKISLDRLNGIVTNGQISLDTIMEAKDEI